MSSKRRLILISLIGIALFITNWSQLFIQQNQDSIGYGISRPFLFVLINAHVIISIILLYLIIRQSIKLFIQRPHKRIENSFTKNLFFAFALFSVIPSFFVFFTAGKFITTSIDDWFHARISTGLDAGMALHQSQTQAIRIALTKTGEEVSLLAQNLKPNLVLAQIQHELQKHIDSGSTCYVLPHHEKELFKAIKREAIVWRTYRQLNDRSTAMLKQAFIARLTSTSAENIFDFYGSLYWKRSFTEFFIVLAHRYPPEIRMPLIDIQNSLQDYHYLKSMHNPIYTNYLYTFFLITLFILFLSLWCAFYLSNRISQPIKNLIQATKRLKKGEWSTTIRQHPESDLQLLEQEFNEMVKAIEQARIELERKNTLKTWRKAAQQMAHEIKNPLTPIQLAAQRLERKYKHLFVNDHPFADCTSTIIEQVGIVKKLIDHFSEFATMPPVVLEPVNIDVIISGIIKFYISSYPAIIFSYTTSRTPDFSSDPKKLNRVFINLLDNSIRALEENPYQQEPKTITISASLNSETQILTITVTDNGPGVDPAIKGTLFLPHVSTNKKNTGLGLAIVQEAITQLNGTIILAEKTQGAIFIITLPAKSLINH